MDYDPDVHGPLNYYGNILEARRYRPWLVYNESIHTGYRINFLSYKRLLFSACRIHNETTNFWSHFLGGLLFIFFLVYFTVLYAPLTFDIDIINQGQLYAHSQVFVTDGLVQSLNNAALASRHATSLDPWLHGAKLEVGVIRIIDEMKNLEVNLKDKIKESNSTKLEEFS